YLTVLGVPCRQDSKTEIKRLGEYGSSKRRKTMKELEKVSSAGGSRRELLRNGAAAAGVATAAGMVIPGRLLAADHDGYGDDAELTKGDIAILRLLSAAEQIETDLWLQFSEVGGSQDNEVSGLNGGNSIYSGALELLDGDMSQYVHDNPDDEITHHNFLNKYLESKGAEPVYLS